MPWEAIASISTLVSAFVIAVAAVFAFAQIRQLRASRQLAGFLEIVRAFHSPDIQAARNFVAS